MFIHEKLRIAETDKLISIVGGGGKTTLLFALAREALSAGARPVILTSTHLAEPCEEDVVLIDDREGGVKEAMETARAAGKIPLVGQRGANRRRVTSPGPIAFDEAVSESDRAYVEADGAAHHPVKYPEIWDPVNPKGTDKVILVAGLTALGKPLPEVCYRAELAARRMAEDAAEGYLPEAFGLVRDVKDPLTEVILDEKLLALILAAGYRRFRPTVLLNQADTPELETRGELVREFLAELGMKDVVVGSLHRWTEERA